MNQERDLLNIIGYLFKNGANPTIKAKMGLTPKEIADMHKFKIGSALLGESIDLKIFKLHTQFLSNRNPGEYLAKEAC